MSAIKGAGYGSKHDWTDRGTIQSPFREARATEFVCRKCEEVFFHYYHIHPDIFAAMEKDGISEECIK